MQAKTNLELYAITSMQTKNQNEIHRAILPPSLNKALLFKVRKLAEGDQKKTISLGLVQSAPKLCSLVIISAHEASATPSHLQDITYQIICR